MIDGLRLAHKANKLFKCEERYNVDAVWEELSEFILPSQSGSFITQEESLGVKKTRRLFDSTAIQSNQDLAAAIHSTLTNPSTKWSKIRYRDEDLNNDDESIKWLEEANNRIHQIINESNFDVQISKNYQMYTD